jgi:hypothetical protein
MQTSSSFVGAMPVGVSADDGTRDGVSVMSSNTS